MTEEFIGLSFLFLASLFIISLIRSIMKLIDYNWDKNTSNAKALMSIFSLPLISFILFLIFVFWILPALKN
jgi:hypothetical protein